MDLADCEVIRQEQRQLLPQRWFGLGPFINRFIAPLPGIRQLCLRTYLVGPPGTAKQNLKIIETPIHYKARTFGETQISRFRDGWLLLKMVWFAYRKLKAV